LQSRCCEGRTPAIAPESDSRQGRNARFLPAAFGGWGYRVSGRPTWGATMNREPLEGAVRSAL